jgi:transcriptional regulator with XRE-family HTH domain
MIKNEKQYRITKAQVRRFQDAVAEVAGQARPSNISARLWEAQREAARSQMEELGEQVEAYERLNTGRSKGVVLEGVEDLPKALIRARIAAGMTQESLARRLGVKPQQVQRYEATEYGSASFARILKVVQALGLSMPKAARLVRNNRGGSRFPSTRNTRKRCGNSRRRFASTESVRGILFSRTDGIFPGQTGGSRGLVRAGFASAAG